jgi:predicted ATPase
VYTEFEEVVLFEFSSQMGRFQFVHQNYGQFPGSNTFTVIVGRNGTGKSRLLRSLILNLMGGVLSGEHWDRSERGGRYEPVGNLQASEQPTHIISVSTSPFDRFPLPRRGNLVAGYTYLGLRGLPSSNLSLAYLSKIVGTLFLSAQSNPVQAEAVAGVLEYLDYEPAISVSLQLIPDVFIKELAASAENPHKAIEQRMMRTIGPYLANEALQSYRQMFEASTEDVMRAVELLQTRQPSRRQRTIHLRLDKQGIGIGDIEGGSADFLSGDFVLSEALLLLRVGMLRLKDVVLYKRGKRESFNISDASSGEQAVVLSLLGIGSQIKNGALVCIDEPEICLHPEWQERYIHLLYRTFSHFEGCHFVIATHSPQIVAQLPAGNCHVMSMETGIAEPSKSFSHKSIDYQLAEVFQAPGYRNEYLSRTALTLFSSVSKKRAFDLEARITMGKLERMIHLLHDDDPVRDLILALKEMRSAYE